MYFSLRAVPITENPNAMHFELRAVPTTEITVGTPHVASATLVTTINVQFYFAPAQLFR